MEATRPESDFTRYCHPIRENRAESIYEYCTTHTLECKGWEDILIEEVEGRPPINEEVTMKRFIAVVALAGVVGMSFGATVQSSTKVAYTPPKPEFTMSDEIPPWKEAEWRGIHWVNDSHVPCTIVLYLGTPIFWIACEGMDSVQRNLQEFAFGKPITIRYIPGK